MSGRRIRVAIIDDHPALRDGTAVLLEQQGGIEVVGRVDSLAAARELVSSDRVPDVLVLDVRLAQERGLDLLGDVEAASGGRPAIVVWTGFDLPQYASYALRAGASGFVVKTAPLTELVAAIRTAAAGGLHFDRDAIMERPTLTPRERDVLSYVMSGRSNDEIATAMGVSSRAVEAHLTRLYQRFDVASRTELATRAIQEGWLDLPTHA